MQISFSDKDKEGLTTFYLQFTRDGHPFDSQDTMSDTLMSLLENSQASSIKEISNKVNSTFYIPKRTTPSSLQNITNRKIGRNDVCPDCNSGKKYKNCCGR